MTHRFRLLLIGAVATLGLAAAALALTVGGAAGGGAAKAKVIEFNVLQIELKGGTGADKLAPPAADPSKLSDGYGYKAPGAADPKDPQRWEVSAYGYSPAQMVACKGTIVQLRMFVVNGDEHKDWIEAPNGDEVAKEAIHNRGREYVVRFTAKQVGDYRLKCNKHEPTMVAHIRVLPTSSC